MDEDALRRLIELRPILTNVIGFYDLLYEHGDLTPDRRMIYEAHFATSAHRLAVELYAITEAIIRQADE